MKVCAIADPHGPLTIDLKPADMLVIAGDLTGSGKINQLKEFRKWLVNQPFKHKVVIAGNHDFCFENPHTTQEAQSIMGGDGITYLQDQLIEIEGKRIYGTPWQPWFYDWAFNLSRGSEIKRRWDLIPSNLDILLVHGPPYGYGDTTTRRERVGCEDLLEAIVAKRPRFTCFGHIHEDVGRWQLDEMELINCSVGYGVGFGDSGQRGPFYFDI